VTDIVFPHGALILDACCLINLLATAHVEAIIDSLPCAVFVADYVLTDEVIKLEDEPFRSNAEGLQRCIDAGKVQIADFESATEQMRFIELAGVFRLDDGEAKSAAIAVERDWAIASDDRKIHTVIPRIAPAIRLLTTPELIKHWSDTRLVDPRVLVEAMLSIECNARYRPARHHPLGDWWHNSTG